MTGAPHRSAARPEWGTWPQAAVLLLRGTTVKVAWRVALVVGTVLSLVNQGAVLAEGRADTATWLRIVVNYLVPYVVASIGFLTACRVPRAQPHRPASELTSDRPRR